VTLSEGSIIKGIMYRRIFKEHKHFVQVTVGPPGSGKSYKDIRQAELWYKEVLKKPFPIENICFSPQAVMERINSKALEDSKGEIIIYEEGGTSMGNLDFQTTVAKIFNYILQSFRSMNIILFINLPYFTMLNKQTRMLTQFLMESLGIDKSRRKSMFKPFYLQVSQRDGQIYTHSPEAVINGYYEKINELNYSMPDEEILKLYEAKKKQFLKGLLGGGIATLENQDKKRLTPFQMQVYNLLKEGIEDRNEIAKHLNVNVQRVYDNIHFIKQKGYDIEDLAKKNANYLSLVLKTEPFNLITQKNTNPELNLTPA
jgi:hypothetical protein